MQRQLTSRSPSPVEVSSPTSLWLPEHTGGAFLNLRRAVGVPPLRVSPTDVLALQRTTGNGVVQRLLASQARAEMQPPGTSVTPPPSAAQPAPVNRTGLPDGLKAGVEALSGYSMDDVRVHRNSSEPAQLQAHAYTQGTDIHVAPGQERHLPHEAWHVVQQKQGRVRPTLQMKSGVPINDDAGLEREATTMGTRALAEVSTAAGLAYRALAAPTGGVVQRQINDAQIGYIRAFTVPGSEAWVKDSTGAKYWVSAITDKTVTLTTNTANPMSEERTLKALKDNYSLGVLYHRGIRILVADLDKEADYEPVRNETQVIDLSNDPLAFAHYSYDLVRLQNDQTNQRDNDHLTIENALPLFLAKLSVANRRVTRAGLEDIKWFVENKRTIDKAKVYEQLMTNHGLPEVDNFNFRPIPAQQVVRPLGTLDPHRELAGDPDRKSVPSNQKDVDELLNLQQFVVFLGRILAGLNVPELVIARIERSISEIARTRMDFRLNQLFLNRNQTKYVLQFVLTMHRLGVLNNQLPGPLQGLTDPTPRIRITRDDFTVDLRTRLSNLLPAIGAAIEERNAWEATLGQSDFNTAATAIVDVYWPMIRGWIVQRDAAQDPEVAA